MIVRVTVMCDNTKHPTKAAKVSTFYVVDGKVRTRDNGRNRRDRRNHRMKVDPWSPKASEFITNGDTSVPACNLCGCSLPVDPRVNRAVETIAAQGGHELQATLSEVAAIISS